jgi:hypothetical protein
VTGPQARITHLTANLTRHGEHIANILLNRQLGDPIDTRRPETTGRTTGVPRPTETGALHWADAQQRDARHLGRLLTGHDNLTVLGAAQIAERLGNPLPDSYPVRINRNEIHLTIDRLVALAGTAEPTTHQWRAIVTALGQTWHLAASMIHDGWYQLHAARHTVDSRGLTVLDQTAEADALAYLGHIEKLERQLAGLLRRLTPANIPVCAADGCRRALGDSSRDGLCDECAGRPCRCGCGQTVPRGKGATHPTCRQRQRRTAPGA